MISRRKTVKQSLCKVLLLLPALFLLAAALLLSCGGDNKKPPRGDDTSDASVVDGDDAGADDDDNDDNDTSGLLDPDNPFGGISGTWGSGGDSQDEEQDGKAVSNHKLRSAGVVEMKSESYRLFIGSLDMTEPVYQKNSSYQVQVTW